MEKAWLFGASDYGRRAYEELGSQFEIQGFLDNDKNKWGGVFSGCGVFSPDEAVNAEDERIIITSSYADEIAAQLKGMGRRDFYVYPSLTLDTFRQFPDKELCKRLDQAVLRLYAKWRRAGKDDMGISDYSRKYLASKSLRFLWHYSGILYAVLFGGKRISTLLEYGGGTGLLSLLAVEAGIPHVYYNDIYEVSCRDAERIAKHMGYHRESVICGDIGEVLDDCGQRGLAFDAVVSYDVIEHIYDLKDYYGKLKGALSAGGTVCMESGANSYNPAFWEESGPCHLRLDFLDRKGGYGHKERDSLRAYYDIRLEIIENDAGQNNYSLKEAEKIALAFLTRGMARGDVEAALKNYVEREELPVLDKFFPYNTCDPYTGNWAEHIINFEALKKELKEMGYQTDFLFYGKKETSPTIRVRSVLP